jgi:hypothetical protein
MDYVNEERVGSSAAPGINEELAAIGRGVSPGQRGKRSSLPVVARAERAVCASPASSRA